MKFFIDTANLDQIREAHDLGVLDGVTTNPSLNGKEGNKRFQKQPRTYLGEWNNVKSECKAEGDGN